MEQGQRWRAHLASRSHTTFPPSPARPAPPPPSSPCRAHIVTAYTPDSATVYVNGIYNYTIARSASVNLGTGPALPSISLPGAYGVSTFDLNSFSLANIRVWSKALNATEVALLALSPTSPFVVYGRPRWINRCEWGRVHRVCISSRFLPVPSLTPIPPCPPSPPQTLCADPFAAFNPSVSGSATVSASAAYNSNIATYYVERLAKNGTQVGPYIMGSVSSVTTAAIGNYTYVIHAAWVLGPNSVCESLRASRDWRHRL